VSVGVTRSLLADGILAGLEMWAPPAAADEKTVGPAELPQPDVERKTPELRKPTDDAPPLELARAHSVPRREDAQLKPRSPIGEARGKSGPAPMAAASRPAAQGCAAADDQRLSVPAQASPARRMSRRL